jgi:hypothetical protein
MKTSLERELDWKTLISFLPANYEQLAETHKQLNTQWNNAKFTSADILLRFIFLHVGADMPLRQTVATIAAAGGPSVQPVRLHHKMRRAKPYLASLVAGMTADASERAPERWGGYEMMALDGTTVSGPSAENVDARIHAVIRLSDLAITGVQVTDVRGGETLRRFGWMREQLVIADRGYANAPGVAWVVDEGADVLVRVNRGALPLFTAEGTPIDVLAWCRDLSGHRAADVAAHLVHRDGRAERRIDGRLIGFRLPEKEAEDARQRVLREHGADATADQLEAAEYIILFTTAPSSRLSAARCVEAYRLRWQIELQFKRWKSLCHFDRLPNYRDDTIQSWLTAKVLIGMLLDRIGSEPVPIPVHTSRSSRAMARQPWKLTSIVMPLLVSAIMPFGLRDAVKELPALVERLDAMDHAPDARQLTLFRNRFYPDAGTNVH